MAANTFSVVSGPDKWSLAVALFNGGPEVQFQVNCPLGTTFAVLVTSAQAHDGSRNSWNIEGLAKPLENARDELLARSLKNPGHKPYQPIPHRVFINFNTKTAKGTMRFFD